ncbi:hypothetical protein ARMSODRAFT_960017 [Armillaria solidipes]|uniref:Uncharacterized protein n=1 Tax=Armillaria solidipes TaxID=1076256 RepID=A0A2H3BIJ3_9AGAR|nr:hypothetical protein ARMSODRAFT_960017 [Armillaria solidipes]
MSSNAKDFEAIRPADAVADICASAVELPRGTRHDQVQAEMKDIKHQIKFLENLERTLATQYGMVRDFDSVEVLGQAKRLAFANRDHQSVRDLQELDRLNDLRLRLNELRHSPTVSPPINASAYYMSPDDTFHTHHWPWPCQQVGLSMRYTHICLDMISDSVSSTKSSLNYIQTVPL